MGIRELVRPFFQSVTRDITNGVVSRLDPARWTAMKVSVGDATALVAGLVIGRRLADPLGVVVLLALHPDGSFFFTVLPTEEAPLPVDEQTARAAVVVAHRRPAARGHAFLASPVSPDLCYICAEDKVAHERARAEEAISRALGAKFETRVEFAGDSAVVVKVEVRTAMSFAMPNPETASTDATTAGAIQAPKPVTRTWRALTWAEEQVIRGLLDKSVRVMALHGTSSGVLS